MFVGGFVADDLGRRSLGVRRPFWALPSFLARERSDGLPEGSGLWVSNHAVQRYTERLRHDLIDAPEVARAILERRLKRARPIRGLFVRRRGGRRDRDGSYFRHGEIVFVVDRETRTVATILPQHWMNQGSEIVGKS